MHLPWTYGSHSFKCCIGLSGYLVGPKLKKTRKKDPRVPQQNENKYLNLENFHKNPKIVILQHHLFPISAHLISYCTEKKGFEEGQVGVRSESLQHPHLMLLP